MFFDKLARTSCIQKHKLSLQEIKYQNDSERGKMSLHRKQIDFRKKFAMMTNKNCSDILIVSNECFSEPCEEIKNDFIAKLQLQKQQTTVGFNLWLVQFFNDNVRATPSNVQWRIHIKNNTRTM